MAPREASGAAVVCCRRGREKKSSGCGVPQPGFGSSQMKMGFFLGYI